MIDFVSINCDGKYEEWHFDSVNSFRKAWFSYDEAIPSADDPVAELEIAGIPMYVNCVNDIINLLGIELDK